MTRATPWPWTPVRLCRGRPAPRDRLDLPVLLVFRGLPEKWDLRGKRELTDCPARMETPGPRVHRENQVRKVLWGRRENEENRGLLARLAVAPISPPGTA